MTTVPRMKAVSCHSLARAAVAIAWIGLLAGTRPALAEEEVGTVAALEGSARIGRGGTWEPAAIGSAIHLGDKLETGQPGQMRVVFRDDTVLNLADDTHIDVDEGVFAPNEGLIRSSMKLLRGKVRALVGEYYSRPGAAYELQTGTAVAGVRGTEFIVSYDPSLEVTRVIGIEGRVEVRNSRDRIAQGVFISSGELTQIDRGRAPDAPRLLDDAERRRYMQNLDFVSAGARGLAAADPLVARQTVPAPDRAPDKQVRGNQYDPGHRRDVSDLLGQPPTVVEKTAGGARISF